jgi:hypothetical protein
MPNAYPVRVTEPEVWGYIVVLTGAGAATPTKTLGQGVTVGRSGAGVLSLTWGENPGTFLGCTFGFGATTAADLDGWTVSHGPLSASYVLPLAVFDEAPAAADLPAATTLTLIAWFKRTGV